MHRICAGILYLSIFAFTSCQHARVGLSPALISPASRQAPQANVDDPSITKEKDRLILKQNYYAWGYLPRERVYREDALCPSRGIKEIHQYYAAEDLILEQLTLGIYSPRTLEIRCH